jgi:hypothetical protein
MKTQKQDLRQGQQHLAYLKQYEYSCRQFQKYSLIQKSMILNNPNQHYNGILKWQP